MNIKLMVVLNDGSTQELSVPAEARVITLNTDSGLGAVIELPGAMRNGFVHTTIETDKCNTQNLPDVSVCVGEKDDKGFIWRSDAMMYVTPNGRIIGKNRTYGYASTEKPLSTKPWNRDK
jgi:hypothetical protein